jgi:hypothetical protein
VGLNYHPASYAELMEKHPEMIVYGSETSSCVSSMGVYHLPIEAYKTHESLQVSSYDLIGPPWAYGRKVKGKDKPVQYVDYHNHKVHEYETPYRFRWDVPYVPGELKVIGYTDGKAVAEKVIATAANRPGFELHHSPD